MKEYCFGEKRMKMIAIQLDVIYHDLCERKLTDISSFPNESIDFIITSPPYSNQRKKTYGGVKEEEYISWMLPITLEMYRILKPSGSLILNIKEHAINGERSTYVIELILAMKSQGWRWVEEYCWYKKTSYPGKWINRFRDSFERCLHFTKNKSFYMNQEAVKVPIGDWAEKRFKSMTHNDMILTASRNNEHLKKKVSNWLGKQTVNPHNVLVFEEEHFLYPTNVIEISPVTNNRNHSACFPLELPFWFIKLFSKPGDIVLDPFFGIGTTGVAAKMLNRHYIGVEKESNYITIAEENIYQITKIYCDD